MAGEWRKRKTRQSLKRIQREIKELYLLIRLVASLIFLTFHVRFIFCLSFLLSYYSLYRCLWRPQREMFTNSFQKRERYLKLITQAKHLCIYFFFCYNWTTKGVSNHTVIYIIFSVICMPLGPCTCSPLWHVFYVLCIFVAMLLLEMLWLHRYWDRFASYCSYCSSAFSFETIINFFYLNILFIWGEWKCMSSVVISLMAEWLFASSVKNRNLHYFFIAGFLKQPVFIVLSIFRWEMSGWSWTEILDGQKELGMWSWASNFCIVCLGSC